MRGVDWVPYGSEIEKLRMVKDAEELSLLGYGSAGRLADRVPVTIEPGVYLPGQGGVRIEVILVVGGDGTNDPVTLLTTTTRELLAV